MKNKTKIIDKITIILMTILFLVAVIYMATWSLAQMSIVYFVLQIVLLIALILIPLVCVFAFVSIMFIIRYIENKEDRLKRVLKTVGIIVVTLVVIFSAHYILLEYCLLGVYEIKVEKKLDEIEDIHLQSIVESSLKKYEDYKQFKIQKVMINQGFPDDYHVNIHYKNNYGVNKIERYGFLSDSEGYELIENAENLTEKYMPIDTALFILGTILLIVTYIHLLKEYKTLSNISLQKELELSPEKLEEKRKLTKRLVLIVIGLVAVVILVTAIDMMIEKNKVSQINTNTTKNETSKEDDTIFEGDILYEKVIDENTRVRVVCKGAVLAQRSIIGIEKTTDGGENWTNQIKSYDGFIQIHNGAEFVFLDENIGFINDPGLAGTDGDNRGLLVTTDGGNNIEDAKIIHPDNITEKNLFVSGLPYIEDNTLKVKIYTINHKKDEIYTYYEFISEDNGKTWEYSKEL